MSRICLPAFCLPQNPVASTVPLSSIQCDLQAFILIIPLLTVVSLLPAPPKARGLKLPSSGSLECLTCLPLTLLEVGDWGVTLWQVGMDHSCLPPLSGEIFELKAELNSDKKEKKKEAVKKVIASMTVGKDVRCAGGG